MIKNKGFTLIELLAIIVILGLIALAAIPNISKQVKESEKQEQTVLNKKIENASKLYAAKYYANEIVNCSSSSSDNPCIDFSLTDLENDGLLSLNDDQCKGYKSKNISVYMYLDKIKFDYTNIENDSCYK